MLLMHGGTNHPVATAKVNYHGMYILLSVLGTMPGISPSAPAAQREMTLSLDWEDAADNGITPAGSATIAACEQLVFPAAETALAREIDLIHTKQQEAQSRRFWRPHSGSRAYVWSDANSATSSWSLNVDDLLEAVRKAQAEFFQSRRPPFTPQVTPPPIKLWRILGLPGPTDYNTARRAYLDKCKEHHPDTGGDCARMQEVTEAWQELCKALKWEGQGS